MLRLGITSGLAALLLLLGCADDAAETDGTTSGGAGSPSGSGGGGSQSATGTTGATTGASTTSGGTGGGAPEPILRFVALGDGGEGNETQYAVAAAMKTVCETAGGCEFALYLGDNIYDSGVSGVRDEQFQTKFELPYAEIPFLFYVVLGNHDYGGNGAGFEFWKGDAQVDYTQASTKWVMPSHYYRFQSPADAGPEGGPSVDFFGLDTNAIMFSVDEEQQDWLDGQVAASTAQWRIGFGHHPYVSNGQHGNAGEYEGISGIPVVSGGNVKDFFDQSVCGAMDVYISGHDHNRQWLEPTCGTEFIVSGTAAKTTDLEGRDTPTFFEDDADGGFLLVEIQGNEFRGTFHDEAGVAEYTRTFTKP